MLASMWKRLSLALLAAAAVTLLGPTDGGLGLRPARASVAVAYELDELVDLAALAVVARASERHSQWERVAGSRRIVTYTKLDLLETIYRRAKQQPEARQTVWVRTLGGVVGHIGQQVGGQPRLRLGQRALLFLMPSDGSAMVVAGAAQGHFPVREPVVEGARAQLELSPALAMLVSRKHGRDTVQRTLRGADLADAVDLIRATKLRRDALHHRQ